MDDNPDQVTKAFHLLTECLYLLTIQYYDQDHQMFKIYANLFLASQMMESYLKTHYPDEFSESFKDESED